MKIRDLKNLLESFRGLENYKQMSPFSNAEEVSKFLKHILKSHIKKFKRFVHVKLLTTKLI